MQKKITARGLIWMLLYAGIAGTGISSCEKSFIDVGSELVDNDITNLVLVDSCTMEFSTVYVDSFSTSGTGVMLAGNYTDPAFGSIAARSYVQIGLPTEDRTIPNGSVFDSLEFILPMNRVSYGDTTLPFTVNIHQLTDVIKIPANQGVFYNTNTRSYHAAVLGSKQVLLRYITNDTIRVRLPQAMGLDLFNKLSNSDAAVESNEKFINYFKGLAITGNGNNNLVTGFTEAVIMRLHYRKPNIISEATYLDFPVNDKSLQFNNITNARAGTPIAALGPANKQIFSWQTQQSSFSQFISGSMIKVRFPYLRSLLQLPRFTKIIRAELVLKPVKDSYSTVYKLPGLLRIAETDQQNYVGADIGAYDGSGQFIPQYGNLFEDVLYGTGTAYTYDVTGYLQSQIAVSTNNKNGLLLLPPSPSTVFNRVVIGDRNNAANKSILKIYYASVK
jgi:hypothetical protein